MHTATHAAAQSSTRTAAHTQQHMQSIPLSSTISRTATHASMLVGTCVGTLSDRGSALLYDLITTTGANLLTGTETRQCDDIAGEIVRVQET